MISANLPKQQSNSFGGILRRNVLKKINFVRLFSGGGTETLWKFGELSLTELWKPHSTYPEKIFEETGNFWEIFGFVATTAFYLYSRKIWWKKCWKSQIFLSLLRKMRGKLLEFWQKFLCSVFKIAFYVFSRSICWLFSV